MLDHELIPMTVDDREVLGRALDTVREALTRDPWQTFLKSFLLPALGFAALIAGALFLAHRMGWVSDTDPVMNPIFWALAASLLALWGCADFARARRAWRAQRTRLDTLESDWAAGQLAVAQIEVKSAVRIDTPGASALALLQRDSDRVVIIDACAIESATDACAPASFELKWCPASALTLPIDASGTDATTPIAGPVVLEVLPVVAPDAMPLGALPDDVRAALVDQSS